ncbi:hypothetical protein [Flagellimonas halotolerans]|uniref:Uncharacterized protein n=1 Tax=Flagellimonas halotolerans TaxID=3112164 RepID=A0ABU6ILN7_9FLAO|nr:MULTISPECIES: hypothetical protein [unclassified Allomuricauda]MEC3964144.1 hypothetical protein [Muricauda sp. SYSU M86414]MEC4264014.1 hypothetical protein [Muricauda sp. SYSU M84420]
MEHKKEFEKAVEKKVKSTVKKVVKIAAMVILGVLIFLLANYVLMRLWNWLMPDLFGVGTVTYWQALGIFVLAKLLFGFGGGGKGKGGSSHKKKIKSSNKCGSWRRDFDEWKHYDQFWKEEGEEAFKAYIEKIKNENHDKSKEE